MSKNGRSETDSTSISRRSVLKRTASGAGAGIVGLASPVVARETVGSDRFEQFEDLPEVQVLLSELGHDGFPNNAEATQYTFEEMAEDLVVSEIPFEYGSFKITKIGDVFGAGFVFHSEEEANNTYQAPENTKYRSIPPGVDAWLLEHDNEAVFRRTATDRERDAILEEISIDIEDPVVYTGSETSGFFVQGTLSEGKSDLSIQESENSGFNRYKVTPIENKSGEGVSEYTNLSDSEFEVSTESVPVQNNITQQGAIDNIQAAAADCGDEAVGCLAGEAISAAVCRLCVPPCATVGTGVGAVLCVGCILATCTNVGSVLPGSCFGPGGVVDCVTDYV